MSRPLALLLLALGLVLLAWLAWPTDHAGRDLAGDEARGGSGDGDLLSGEGAPASPRQDPTLAAHGERPAEEPAYVVPDGARPITLRGRVLDARARPVAGAVVTGHGAAGLGSSSRTDAAGAYELPWHSVLRGTTIRVRARSSGGTVGSADVWVWPSVTGPWPVETITLGAALGLTVRVVRGDVPVADAVVRAYVWLSGQEHHDRGLVATVRAGPAGVAQLDGLVADNYLLEASDAQGRRGTASRYLHEAAPAPVTIPLQDDHPVSVRLVDAKDLLPLPGIVVELQSYENFHGTHGFVAYAPPEGVPPTDAEGHVLLRGLGGIDGLLVTARPPGYSVASQQVAVGPTPDEILLRLERLAGMRWSVVPGERPVPPPGSGVKLWPLEPAERARVGSLRAVMEGSMLVCPTRVHGVSAAFAEAPDGSRALVSFDTDEEIAFGPPRTVTVRLATAAGAPIPGFLVTLRTAGTYPYAASTDADGRVRFADLPAATWEVLSVNGALGASPADTRTGDAHVDITFGPEQRIELEVRVAGEARLPPGLTVTTGAYVLARRDDPARGVVELLVCPRPGQAHDAQGAQSLEVAATGLIAGELQILDSADDRVRCRVDLRRTRTLTVRVTGGDATDVRLQRFDLERGRWQMTALDLEPSFGALMAPVDRQVEGVTAGRYRALALSSGAVSSPVDVGEDAAPPPLVFDLSAQGSVLVHVEVPDGFEASDVRVDRRVEGHEDSDWRPDPTTDRMVAVPGDRRVTFQPVGTLLAPHPTRGTVTVVRAGGEVRLELVARPQIAFRLEGVIDEDGIVVWIRPAGGGDVEAHSIETQRDTYRCPLPSGGVEELWVQVQGGVPIHRRGPLAPGAQVDLGVLRPLTGGTVIVLVPAGRSGSGAWAVHQGTPPYELDARIGDDGRAVLTGFGPGRFALFLEGSEEEHRLESDGASTTTLDLR